jgi:hypothetical protein
MTTLLNSKPVLGSIAGFASTIIYVIRELLTNDTILKYIAGLGIWLGILIALLTVYLRIVEIRRSAKALNHNEK